MRIALLGIALLCIGPFARADGGPGSGADDPIPLQGVTEREFFGRVLGPCARPVRAEFVESCCPRTITVPGPMDALSRETEVTLRKHAVWVAGAAEPLILYVDPHREGTPSVPVPLQLLPKRSSLGSAWSPAEITVAPTCTCEFEPSPEVEYTEQETCVFALVEERCGLGDQCLLDCWSERRGAGVGGGCWHVCFAYSGLPMPELPAGARACSPDDAIPEDLESESSSRRLVDELFGAE